MKLEQRRGGSLEHILQVGGRETSWKFEISSLPQTPPNAPRTVLETGDQIFKLKPMEDISFKLPQSPLCVCVCVVYVYTSCIWLLKLV